MPAASAGSAESGVPGSPASGESVADISGRTRADGAVADGLAASLHTARVQARILALEVVTGLVNGAITIVVTFTSGALSERVTPGSLGAKADGSVGAGGVVARLALGALSAWVRCAQVSAGELAAGVEGVAGESPGARTDGLVVPHHAIGAAPTHVGVGGEARVLTLELDTCLVKRAIVVFGAFCVASGVSISQEVGWTCATGLVVTSLAQ